MRTEQARPVRLQDYRPPDWLVETVHLDVALHPNATRVRAQLRLKPNPAAEAPAPLVLDGDGLSLAGLKLDGSALPAERYVATPDRLTIAQPPAGPCELEIETVIAPSARPKAFAASRISPTGRT
jgi:aminopeptidase N